MHVHKPKVVEWGFDKDRNWIPSNYGCTECIETFVDLPPDEVEILVPSEFAKKIKTLQFSTGDANSGRQVAQKKWDNEVNAFAAAEVQGIQPDGVFQRDIDAAHQASEILGTAYNADKMLPAHQITPGIAEVYKEIGVI